jgi:hypothetical protein
MSIGKFFMLIILTASASPVIMMAARSPPEASEWATMISPPCLSHYRAHEEHLVREASETLTQQNKNAVLINKRSAAWQ